VPMQWFSIEFKLNTLLWWLRYLAIEIYYIPTIYLNIIKNDINLGVLDKSEHFHFISIYL